MDIANLLAQGTRARPAGMEQNALMQGQEMQRRQMQNELMRLQQQQQQQAYDMQQRENALIPQHVIKQNAPGDGIGPTQPGGFNYQGYAQSLAGVNPMKALQLQQLMQKENPTTTLAEGGQLVESRTGRVLASNPKSMKDETRPEYLRIMSALDELPANDPRAAGLRARLKVLETANAGTQVNLTSPVPVNLPGGGVGLVQPSNKPGAPPQLLRDPTTNQPYTKPGEEQKPLSQKVVDQIAEARDNAASMTMLRSSFKPEFASKGVAGLGADLQLTASANLGMDKGTVDWWKNYRKMAELVERHAMFGASLSGNEQNSWRSADISPGMDPEVIKKNLATREKIAKRVLGNVSQDAIDAGHSPGKVEKISSRAGAATAVDQERQVVRTGTLNGRKVVQYSDGSTDYAD